MAGSPSKQLSSKVLDMKFMKRKEESDLRVKLAEDREKDLAETQWVLKAGKYQNVITIEQAKIINTCGRRSFGGFNPAIQKLNSEASNQEEKKPKTKKTESENKVDVTDEEMASTFNKNKNDNVNSFYGKRGQNNNNKRKRENQNKNTQNKKKKT